MTEPLFAIERYDDTGGQLASLDEFPELPVGMHLNGAVHLAADDVIIAFVQGPDADTVSAAVAAAGWRVDRIGPASWITDREVPR